MPSVRIRRGSQYASLLDEDGARDDTQRRPRSRTLASIYRPPDFAPDGSLSKGPSPSSGNNDQLHSSAARRGGRPSSKVADSILYGYGHNASGSQQMREQQLRGREASNERFSEMTRGRDGTVVLEGSHADVVVPDDGRGPGILESTLSTGSSHNNDYTDPFRNATEHEDDIVEHLDVIDPEIAAVSNLANAANAILIPPIGIYSRKPVIVLPRVPVSEDAERGSVHEDDLDRHVEEVLSKRAWIRRSLRGVWAFVKTPLGIITAFYGFCVVFWGAAIVFFLAKFINFHDSIKQGFWVEVSSQVENALFTVIGIGLIPWRVVDTYRILRIWHYKRLTRELRAKANLLELYDEDDLPDPIYDPNYVHVLTEEQERNLHHQQRQFAKSQTWYRPHGTPTHRAFPIETALLICCFNDGNSMFQIILCTTMWSLNRFERPAWSTGILIPASFLCGIASAVFIWRGGAKTKRTKEVEERLRLALKIERNPDKFRLVEAKAGISQRFTSEAVSGSRRDASRTSPKSQNHEHDPIALPNETGAMDDRDVAINVDEKMEVPPSYALK